VHLGSLQNDQTAEATLNSILGRVLGANKVSWKYLKTRHFTVAGSDGVCGLLPDG
jgi:hypothetical protein